MRLAAPAVLGLLLLAGACGGGGGEGQGAKPDGPALSAEPREPAAEPLPPAPPAPPSKPGSALAPATPPSVAADSGARDALVGVWAPALESCASGEAIRFGAEGYTTEGDSGTWRLTGEALTLTRQSADGGGMEAPAAEDPREVTLTLTAVGADTLAWKSADGSETRFVRCPQVP